MVISLSTFLDLPTLNIYVQNNLHNLVAGYSLKSPTFYQGKKKKKKVFFFFHLSAFITLKTKVITSDMQNCTYNIITKEKKNLKNKLLINDMK